MAIYYFRNTGSTSWNVATNWSLTDGGGATGAVPTSADDAYFTNLSGSCVLNAASLVCKSLIFSGVGGGNYANTFTFTNGVTVSGAVTFSATMTVAGTGTLTVNTSATLTSNGKTMTGGLTFAGTSQTYVLGDNWTVTGAITSSAVTALTVNNNGTTKTLTGNGNLVSGSVGIAGSANIVLGGTGTWTGAGAIKNNLTINTAGTITISGSTSYNTGTLTYTAGTIVNTGNTMTISACTLTTSGMVWNNISVISSSTITLGNDCYIAGTYSVAATVVMNSNTLHLRGNFGFGGASTHSGTTTLLVDGTGAQSWTASSSGLQNNLTINCSGTLSIPGNVLYNTGTMTYTAGTVSVVGTLTVSAATTLNTNGITWSTLAFSGSSTITFLSNATCTTLTFNGNIVINGFKIYNSGMTVNANVSGTTDIEINGSGTWSGLTGFVTNNVTINCTTLTITGTAVGFRTGTLTYTSGTVTTTGSTLVIGASATLNTAGISWYNVTLSGTPTITINSLLTISNTLTTTTTTTFAGTSGWTTANYTLTTVGITITYAASKTYTITTALTLTGTAASNIVFVSGTPGTRYNFVLNSGATQDVSFVNATDADSSAAQTIWDFKGSRSNTLNWNALTAPLTISSTFSS